MKRQSNLTDFAVAGSILFLVIACNIVIYNRAHANPVVLAQSGSSSYGYSSEVRIFDTETYARENLRSLGSSQTAYAAILTNGRYGTFDDLQSAHYILADFTTENYVTDYHIFWYLNRDRSDFVILALPDEGYDKQPYMIDNRGMVMAIESLDYFEADDEWQAILDDLNDSVSEYGEYDWVNLPVPFQTALEYDLFLSGDGLNFMLNHAAPYILYNNDTGEPEPEYFFWSLNGLFYEAILVEEDPVFSSE